MFVPTFDVRYVERKQISMDAESLRTQADVFLWYVKWHCLVCKLKQKKEREFAFLFFVIADLLQTYCVPQLLRRQNGSSVF